MMISQYVNEIINDYRINIECMQIKIEIECLRLILTVTDLCLCHVDITKLDIDFPYNNCFHYNLYGMSTLQVIVV